LLQDFPSAARAVQQTGVDPAQLAAETSSGDVYQRHHTALGGAVRGSLLGLIGGPLFQAWKKVDEANRMEPTPAIHELYGAINYCAAAIIVLEEQIEDSVAEIEDEDEITVTIDGAEVEVEDGEKVDLMTVELSDMEPGESFKLNLNELGGDSELKTIHFRLV
jgi:hypothetical protein